MKVINKISILLFLSLSQSVFLDARVIIDHSIDSLKNLGYYYLDNSKFDSAITVSQIGLQYCTINKDSNIFIFYNQKAQAYYNLNDIDKALETYEEALKENEKRYIVSKADIYFGKANLLWLKGEYLNSKKTYIQARDLYKKNNENYGLVQIQENIGLMEADFTNFSEAVKNLNRALKTWKDNRFDASISKEAIYQLKGEIYHNLGDTYQNWGIASEDKSDFKKAMYYFEEAKKIREQLKDTSGIGSTLLCIAYNYFLTGQLPEAESCLARAENKITDDLKKSTFFLIEGKILAEENKTKEALESFFQSESLAVKNNGLWEKYQVYEEISGLNSIPDSLKDKYEKKISEIKKFTKKESALAQKINVFYRDNIKTGEKISELKPYDKTEEKISELKPHEWLLTALISFVVSLFLLFIFLRKAKTISDFNLGNQYFYLLLIPAGLASSAFLFGALESFASYSGVMVGGEIKMGGPIVLFLIVIWLGFKFGTSPEPFDFTVHLQSTTGIINFDGSVIIQIGNDRKDEEIDHKGSVYFRNIPSSFRNKFVNLILNVDNYVFRNNKNSIKCLLKGKSISLIIKVKNEA